MIDSRREGSLWYSRKGKLVLLLASLVCLGLGLLLLNMVSTPYPIIDTFTATPGSINSGEVSRISWKVIGADTLFLEPGQGPVPCEGKLWVTPEATQTYILTAINATKTRKAEVAVNVRT